MPRCVSPKTNAPGRCGAWAVKGQVRCRLHSLAPEARQTVAREAGSASGARRQAKAPTVRRGRPLSPAEAGRQSWRTRQTNLVKKADERRRARGPLAPGETWVQVPAWLSAPTLAPGETVGQADIRGGTAAPTPSAGTQRAMKTPYEEAVEFFETRAAATRYTGPSSPQERDRLRAEREAREDEKAARDLAKVRDAKDNEERAWMRAARLGEHRLPRWADGRPE